MSIHEERDIVLDKIHALSLRDQIISYGLVVQELEHQYQLNKERIASSIWYLNDCRYIIRDKDNKDEIRLTPKGLGLISEGGFVQKRINDRRDLEDEIDDLSAKLAQQKEQIIALEKAVNAPKPLPSKKANKNPTAVIALVAAGIAIFAVVLLACYVFKKLPA